MLGTRIDSQSSLETWRILQKRSTQCWLSSGGWVSTVYEPFRSMRCSQYELERNIDCEYKIPLFDFEKWFNLMLTAWLCYILPYVLIYPWCRYRVIILVKGSMNQCSRSLWVMYYVLVAIMYQRCSQDHQVALHLWQVVYRHTPYTLLFLSRVCDCVNQLQLVGVQAWWETV